ncbi:hypothetical protein CFBP6600_06030 [Xanthomonas arboricola pv. corylina]|uniref:Uncharacterized protein n=1 Tax=Xanthomonas arboricola pv. corylina TaxID=487821 RepID=A0A8D6UNR1_9XANT|nr:hypothetical protein [Xanthomonas arboricola]SUZ34753.1 hypothetical protein CPBF1521_05950 [Xanthomonas arboricola pv. juglandis]UQQ16349.1 hypothetical protein KPG65_08160 [Xanthomonas arboricola pv. corylina]WIX26433.1 hypothetical protein PUV44_07310 [Xanthomonas arboricola pv. corylina]CAE6700659.1 hypothetical protein CFBP1159_04250 [Xanthomonas arboricola pv. corylina]CAE6700680.1 hypothetical protein CFBP1159_04250 [Xanthomonas arboricola pv. corylina]
MCLPCHASAQDFHRAQRALLARSSSDRANRRGSGGWLQYWIGDADRLGELPAQFGNCVTAA